METYIAINGALPMQGLKNWVIMVIYCIEIFNNQLSFQKGKTNSW